MGHRVEISDSIELCIVELTRVDCIYNELQVRFEHGQGINTLPKMVCYLVCAWLNFG